MDRATPASTSLTPPPKAWRRGEGWCHLAADVRFTSTIDDVRLERAWNRVKDRLNGAPRAGPSMAGGRDGPIRLNAEGRPAACRSGADPVILSLERRVYKHPQRYRLKITPSRIEILGSPVGCFHGLQTLAQLIALHGRVLPCGVIEDEPDLMTRGVLRDVTRGRVPTLATFKRFVDRLAALKINQLQLYIEHAFVFGFDPAICGEDEGLTPDEIRDLDAHCRERFITLVPAVATLGHMGKILSLPAYHHLAEIEAVRPWEEQSWLGRARGLTLDVLNPESRSLVERIWSDLLDAFPGPVVNICGDEPHDLGRGKNRDTLTPERRIQAYVDHVAHACRFVERHGRKAQMWSDVIARHPEAIPTLPPDVTLLHWGYDDEADERAMERFVQAGFETVACPGVSGWKRVLNAMNLADRNITRFARAAGRYGASGLLTTDWGDHGHFNLPGGSAHGIALGAARAWRTGETDAAGFDPAFARLILGLEDRGGVTDLREATDVATECETWTLLRMPIDEMARSTRLPSRPVVEYALASTLQARRALSASEPPTSRLGAPSRLPGPDDVRELALALRLHELFLRKAFCAGRGHRLASLTPTRRQTLLHQAGDEKSLLNCGMDGAWVLDFEEAAEDYRADWRRNDKPGGLEDIERAFQALLNDARATFSP